MRKLVKQSKVRVIRKLTDQLKALKSKRGTEEQKSEKTTKKCESILQEIHHIKKIDPDSVAKFSLRNEVSWEKLASTSNIAEKSKARLGTHKLITDFVLKWRKDHGDWKHLASILSEHVSRRIKTRKPAMPHSRMLGPEKLKLSEGVISPCTEEPKQSEISPSTEEDVTCSKRHDTARTDVDTPSHDTADTPSHDTADTDTPSHDTDEDKKPKNSSRRPPLKKTSSKEQKRTGTQQKRTSFTITGEQKRTDTSSSEKIHPSWEASNMRKAQLEENDTCSHDSNDNKRVKRHPFEKDDDTDEDQKPKNSSRRPPLRKKSFKAQKRTGTQQKRTSFTSTSEQKRTDTSTSEKLHPSWEASKKRKAQLGAIPTFQGKKVTFDD